MTICLSVGGSTVYQSDHPSNDLLVGTVDGVVLLSRNSPGSEWSERRRTLQGKHVSSLLFEPSRGTLFAGVHKDGIYASLDAGATWQRRDDGIEFKDIYSMSCVEVDGQVRLYAGSEPAHLYRSTDLGASWEALPAVRSVPTVDKWTFPAPPHIGHVKHISFDPRSADVIYASIEVGGALKSEDGGRTFRDLPGVYEDVHRIIIPPTAPDRLYTTGGEGIWHSPDAGKTWTHLAPAPVGISYPDGFVVHPHDANLLYTSGSFCSPGGWRKTMTADSRIARSRDAGRTWERLENGLPEHVHGNFEALIMEVWAGGYALAAANTDGEVYYSGDQGDTWARIADGLPAVSKAGHFRNIPRGDEPALAAAR
ncbi:MAG TPA: glycosyl hydrolase [Chloroflexota bacterium]|nr:glycosyl hydrolase [Chloroflexota bacterium]